MGEYQIGVEFEEYEKKNYFVEIFYFFHFNFKRHLLGPPYRYF